MPVQEWGFAAGSLPPLGASPDALLRHAIQSGSATAVEAAPGLVPPPPMPASLEPAGSSLASSWSSSGSSGAGDASVEGLTALLQGLQLAGEQQGQYVEEIVEVKNTAPFGENRHRCAPQLSAAAGGWPEHAGGAANLGLRGLPLFTPCYVAPRRTSVRTEPARSGWAKGGRGGLGLPWLGGALPSCVEVHPCPHQRARRVATRPGIPSREPSLDAHYALLLYPVLPAILSCRSARLRGMLMLMPLREPSPLLLVPHAGIAEGGRLRLMWCLTGAPASMSGPSGSRSCSYTCSAQVGQMRAARVRRVSAGVGLGATAALPRNGIHSMYLATYHLGICGVPYGI
jgi:hypothetical protein